MAVENGAEKTDNSGAEEAEKSGAEQAEVVPARNLTAEDRLWMQASYEKRREEQVARVREVRTSMLLVFLLAICLLILSFASARNPEIYRVDENTLTYINFAFNAVVLLIIPMLLGGLGGFTRLLISGLPILSNAPLLIASGLMSVVSWISIKSGVLMKLVAPHLGEHGLNAAEKMNPQTEFYTMALVAILVGMFSSNVYIFVNQRVERLLAEKKTADK